MDVGLAVGSDDGYIYALDHTSTPPIEQWNTSGHAGFKTGGPVRSSPTIKHWVKYKMPWMPMSPPVAYVGSDDGYVYCIAWDPLGSWFGYYEMWRYMTGGPVRSSPAVANLIDYIDDDGILDQVVVIGSNDGYIYALAGETLNPVGQLLWQYPASGKPPIGAVESSPAIDVYGRVYVGSNDNNVYMLDGQTGKFLDKFETNGSVTSSPAIGPDYTLYVGSDDNYIYALRGVNNPPYPPTISGPRVGRPGIAYDYLFKAVDPDGDEMDLIIDLDDGTIFTHHMYSGEEVTLEYYWNSTGIYEIKAHCQDEHGLRGPVANFTVFMPRNKIINIPFLNFLQQRFLNLFPILRLLLQR
jgi:hypothetical protein